MFLLTQSELLPSTFEGAYKKVSILPLFFNVYTTKINIQVHQKISICQNLSIYALSPLNFLDMYEPLKNVIMFYRTQTLRTDGYPLHHLFYWAILNITLEIFMMATESSQSTNYIEVCNASKMKSTR